ncbi:MAG: hypothetical protein ACYDGN_05425 [Acidimicrobiales bacterium]
MQSISHGGDSLSPTATRSPDPGTLICGSIILEHLTPEFGSYYRDLENLYEEELTDEIVLNELADFFADLLNGSGPDEVIERCCECFEALCHDPRLDPGLTLYDQLLAYLSPPTLERAWAYFGPATEALLHTADRTMS